VPKIFLGVVFLLAVPLVALADPSTTPGYTDADQVQFAKLATANGTWTCKDTPASKKADVISGKQAGNWYVWRESGDLPSITYVRWSHDTKMYVQNEIDASGSTEIYTTRSADPFNAQWVPVYPAAATLFPVTSTRTGDVITSSGRYQDPKTGKMLAFKSVCTKG
jgi:hypothetical protein